MSLQQCAGLLSLHNIGPFSLDVDGMVEIFWMAFFLFQQQCYMMLIYRHDVGIVMQREMCQLKADGNSFLLGGAAAQW